MLLSTCEQPLREPRHVERALGWLAANGLGVCINSGQLLDPDDVARLCEHRLQLPSPSVAHAALHAHSSWAPCTDLASAKRRPSIP